MAWRASGRSNTELVQNLKRVGLIQSPVVEKAFLAVDRGHFVPVGRRIEQRPTEAPAHASAQGSLSVPSSMVFPSPRNDERDEFAQNDPYEDSPQYIGYYATISAPHIQAMCAELLLPYVGRSGARILDIGSGTGYLTAILAKMGEFALQATTETSVDHRESSETIRMEPASTSVASSVILPRVFGVDHIRPLVEDSERNVRASNPELVAERRVVFKADDGRLGWPEYAPYDAIHVGAAADVVPRPLLEQLKPGGRMVIPVGPEGGDQKLIAIDRDEADPSKYVQKDITGVRYVPLCDLAYQWQGALNAEPEEEEKL
ncbi:Protein-L-isoaspartate(D-aspartate) O-methyltransferase [Cyanidiococcus yangmingshanensis]|uniref:protein-L-isoaspartate(D-aspartate) O-methyltransferase n=1 Tax=Cyanidiococcus yangmingshanensis TaxID=2690220 RepID=A0A7J7IHS8_9RHOD|nr:Protein-L-isoaspartate(D-aspartate) O-methyltransferase [Cyanidiococcus yangmingshanensis]